MDKWLSNKGYVDYICPQIYFGFNNSTSPYTETVALWNNKIKVSGISLYIGLAPYKNRIDGYLVEAAKMNGSMIRLFWPSQVQSARDYKKYGGFALFRYASLFAPDSSVKSQVEKEKTPWRTFCKTRERREAAAGRGEVHIMAYLLNNKKILGIVIGVLLAVITLTVTVVAVVANTPEKDHCRQSRPQCRRRPGGGSGK